MQVFWWGVDGDGMPCTIGSTEVPIITVINTFERLPIPGGHCFLLDSFMYENLILKLFRDWKFITVIILSPLAFLKALLLWCGSETLSSNSPEETLLIAAAEQQRL